MAPAIVTCPRCGRPRRVAPGSTLTCHALCLGSEALRDDLLDVSEAFSVSNRKLAADLGVSTYVIHVWLRDALRRRRARIERAS